MELTHGKKDNPKALPSRLVLYLHIKSTEMKEQVRIIKCSRETRQALEVYSSIEQARNTYGQNLSKVSFHCCLYSIPSFWICNVSLSCTPFRYFSFAMLISNVLFLSAEKRTLEVSHNVFPKG